MKKLICLIIVALALTSVSSVNAAGRSKHHHGKKAASLAAGKHHKVHHAKARHHKHA
jgi:hypothetical protein